MNITKRYTTLNNNIATGCLVTQASCLNFIIISMDNNDVLKKLRVALQLRDTDIVEILKLVDFKITTSELGAFFRAEDHPNYKPCGDQILRNFLNGLVIYKRGPKEENN
jgi:uncharacterized protein YehS (DUF1456 family)